MTDNVEYGPEIAVDGMPDWLGEDENVIGRWGEDTWYSGGPTWKKCYASPEDITAIKLPADHAYYRGSAHTPTPRPFAAGDWVVLKETGEVRHLDDLTVFHINDGPNRYRHATPEEITVAGVATARFDTVAELMDDLNDTIRLTKITRSDAEARMLDIPTLTELGLLADPTDIERFEDFHGGLSDSERGIAEAALLWARENG